MLGFEIQQASELFMEHFRAADGIAQGRLPDDHPQQRRIITVQHVLALDPGGHLLLDRLRPVTGAASR